MKELEPKLETKERIIKKLLVVDDDEIVLAAVVATAEMEGYEVVTANSATAAIRMLLKEADIDAVVSDNNMPGGMSGIELLRHLRANEKFKNMPFVLQTAAGSHELEKEVKEVLNGGFLNKPYGGAELKAALESAIQKSE